MRRQDIKEGEVYHLAVRAEERTTDKYGDISWKRLEGQLTVVALETNRPCIKFRVLNPNGCGRDIIIGTHYHTHELEESKYSNLMMLAYRELGKQVYDDYHERCECCHQRINQ